MGPTKHNVICKGKSALDVILGHDDFLQQRGRSLLTPAESIEDKRRIDPEIKVVSKDDNKFLLISTSLKSIFLKKFRSCQIYYFPEQNLQEIFPPRNFSFFLIKNELYYRRFFLKTSPEKSQRTAPTNLLEIFH